MVLRYVMDDWKIKQKVARSMLLAKSMTGEEVARQIIMALSTELGIPSHLVVAAMRAYMVSIQNNVAFISRQLILIAWHRAFKIL